MHVWECRLLDTIEQIKVLAAPLIKEEMAKTNRYRRPIDAKTHVAGRELLCYFLGNYLGSDPAYLRFEYGSQGKPRLAEGKLYFNISHAGDLALKGLSRHRALGV